MMLLEYCMVYDAPPANVVAVAPGSVINADDVVVALAVAVDDVVVVAGDVVDAVVIVDVGVIADDVVATVVVADGVADVANVVASYNANVCLSCVKA